MRGSRGDLSSPRATKSGNVTAYRPSMFEIEVLLPGRYAHVADQHVRGLLCINLSETKFIAYRFLDGFLGRMGRRRRYDSGPVTGFAAKADRPRAPCVGFLFRCYSDPLSRKCRDSLGLGLLLEHHRILPTTQSGARVASRDPVVTS
jgi:hypothetical protein